MNINDYKKVTDRIEPNEKCRDEVLGMNKRENNIEHNINVSGVDVHKGRGISKYIGIAAACMLIVGSVGTTGVLLHNSSKKAVQQTEIEEETVEENVSETDVEEVTETASEAAVENDYDAIARELTDRYIEGNNILCNGDVSYDANDSIVFYTYDSTDEEWSSKFGGERKFYKVTDERFHSCQDIYDYYKSPFASVLNKDNQYADEYELPEDFANAHLAEDLSSVTSWLGGDVSKFELGSRVDLRPYSDDKYEEDNYDDAAFAINNGTYIEYNGELYVSDFATEMPARYWRQKALNSYTSEPVVTETTDNSFTVSRFMKQGFKEYENVKYGDEKVFHIILDNGEWKITNIRPGLQPEYESAIAIQTYLEQKDEYSDIDIDCMDIFSNIEIMDLDAENKKCKVHGTLHDINGVDAIEITADVCIDVDGNYGVTSADITRLK